ncbi:glycoside hydrolase family 16 protein [Microlunatus sp. Gsoil 973]|uniref:glycoside hydrolase family 16 protein n=1 Tax=Microlunatus sp. Gsoil 973 TaxID=2672569 RepID=UPI0012B46627|nr:glycoside hydrolase family 16 protein [Microlunatus sp. Gsoil 973]QGN32231.1 hydrolase [Microlunatus sp. Gsoil 973]
MFRAFNPVIVVGAALAAALSLAGVAPTASAAPPHGVLFDDFDYSGPDDPAVTADGWEVRTGGGGPGVEGATWTADNIAFPRIQGKKSLQLRLTTDGTSQGTTQSEFTQTTQGREGTYLAQIKFSDAPAAGPDGDFMNQTFFAIGPLAADCDPNYSETDFTEYLPNGGWGTPGPLNSETTWYTTGETCSDSVENDQAVSLAGWHTIMATVAGGHVRYYVDGVLVADHAGKYFPREDMVIDFNTWLIDTTGHVGQQTSIWNEYVDYVYYAQNQVLSPKQAKHQVRLLRSHHRFVNTIAP